MNRRAFLKLFPAAAGSASLWSALAGCRTAPVSAVSRQRIPGANEAIRVAVVGFHGQGQSHIVQVERTPGLKLVALCDVDRTVLEEHVRQARSRGQDVVGFSDVRKLLDRKDVDAITIATPNHWHSLMGIWACQAGKDVYVEKPVSHYLWEGRMLVKAARKHRRIVQTGTQARANPDLLEALAWLRAGHLGKIRYAHGMCYKPRLSIGKVGHGELPPGLDYDLWTGPAPLKPLARKNLHYDWHWVHDTGNGDLGNQGIHEMDQARWFLGYQTLSRRVMSVGARLGYDDDGETPNTQLVWHVYDGPPILFEVRGLPKAKAFQADPAVWSKSMDSPAGFGGGRAVGVSIECEGGKLIIDEGGRTLLAMDSESKVIKHFERNDPQHGIGWSKGDRLIFRNWEAVMRSRKWADLSADILEGHLSSALCHLGMISHQLGRHARPEEIREQLRGNPVASDHFEAMKEHLERNEVALDTGALRLGPSLAFDPATERFVKHDAANQLLRRADRKPYVVPEV
jgi:predicted dehydrogenase